MNNTDNLFYHWKKSLFEYILDSVKIGEFNLSSGIKSDFYVDCKKIMLMNEPMKLISDCIFYKTYDLSYFSVAGVTSGADPIVCGCVAHNKKNGLFIRKKQKEHGTKKLIEGFYYDGDEVLIVDDVLTTGDSIKYSYDVLKDHKLKPTGVIIIVDRQENNAKKELEDLFKIPIFSIITKEEIFKYFNTI